MFVNAENVAYYLAERRLLSFDSVVDGDFMVVDHSSRNRNLEIVRERSPGFFIKQVRQRQPAYTRTLEREAACYRLAKEDRRFRALAALMPELRHWDAKNLVLIVELLPHARSLWQHHLELGAFPLDVAELQGEKLGAYHGQIDAGQIKAGAGAGGSALAGLEVFDRQVPWILSIHETNPQYLQQMSRGNAQLIGLLQQHPELGAALAALRESWSQRALIHGDVKWENLVLCRPGGDGKNGDGPAELRIIDWEMADVGDECWDAGAIFQAYMSFWIFNLPLQAGRTMDQAVAESRFDADAMKPAMAAFWTRYARCRRLAPAASRRLLERAMRCAAARMVQTAYEGIQSSPEITPHAVCQLQMSMNILRDPAAAVGDLIGL